MSRTYLEACRNCKFFRPRTVGEFGWCRAHPPAADKDSTEWPVLRPADWCGEWEENLCGEFVQNKKEPFSNGPCVREHNHEGECSL